jgi:hypothetical protein
MMMVAAALFAFVQTVQALSFDEDFSKTTHRSATTKTTWSSQTKVTLPTAPSWRPVSAVTSGATATSYSPAFAQDGIALLGVADGLYRTMDRGVSWTKAQATASAVTAIAFSPTFVQDGTVFAMTNGDGAWKSTSRGASWTRTGSFVGGFGIAPSPSFSSDRTVFAAGYGTVKVSKDGGGTWTEVVNGIDENILDNGDVRGVAVSSAFASDRTVYITALGAGVYRSTDAGLSWSVMNPAGTTVAYASAIAAGPGGAIAAAFIDGAYRTVNRGATWSRILSGDVQGIAFHPKDGGMVFLATPAGVVQWKLSATVLTEGWKSGAGTSVAASSTYPASRSLLVGTSSGAQQRVMSFSSQADAIAKTISQSALPILAATIVPEMETPPGTSIAFYLSVTDGDPVWEGPVAPNKPWTFASSGSSLRWKATLKTSNTSTTPTLTRLTIQYDEDASIQAPRPSVVNPEMTTIEWRFTNRPPSATRIELRARNGASVEVIDGSDATTELAFVETGLVPNTAYCGREIIAIRGEEASSAAGYDCATTLAVLPSDVAVSEVTSQTAVIRFSPGAQNPSDTEYAIQDDDRSRFVTPLGTWSDTASWNPISKWGGGLVEATSLDPATSYSLCVRVRNRAGVVSECGDPLLITTPEAPRLRGDVTVSLAAPSIASEVQIGEVVSLIAEVVHAGDGAARAIEVRIPMPSGIDYIAGSLTVNGSAQTDARDSDGADVGSGVQKELTYRLGTMQGGQASVLTFQGVVGEVATLRRSFIAVASYEPLPDSARRTISSNSLEIPIRPAVAEQGILTVPDGASSVPAVTAGSSDTAGNIVSAPVSQLNTLELLEPIRNGSVAAGKVTVRGGATPSRTVTVDFDGRRVGEAVAGEDGVFAVTVNDVSPGTHRVVVQLGNLSREHRFTVLEPPDDLVIVTPRLGSVTNARTIVVSTRGPALAEGTVALDGVVVGAVILSPSGTSTFIVPGIIPEGTHTLTVRVEIGDQEQSAGTSFSVDRTPPRAPDIGALRIEGRVPSKKSNDRFDVTLAIEGTLTEAELASIDELLVTVVPSQVTFTHRPATVLWSSRATLALPSGPHSLRLAARDYAGNVTSLPRSLAFDVPPSECGDGLDNDNDGATDFPEDRDCSRVTDVREATPGVVTRSVEAVQEAASVTAATVAKTTKTVARATAKQAEVASLIVQEEVLDNEAVEKTNEQVVVPAVAMVVAANTATTVSGLQFLSYLQYLFGLLLQPTRLLGRRKREGWGTVYASLTKRPIDLATVRLRDAKSSRIVQTQVTDHLGRFRFQVKQAGSYRIEVTHRAHEFPSKLLKDRSEDGAHVDLYFGDPITIEAGGDFVAPNIPLDAPEASLSDKQVVRRHYLQLAAAVASNAGIVMTLVSFAISPRPIIGIIVLVNIVLYLLFRRLGQTVRRPKSWGAVRAVVSRNPLALSVVRLFDAEFNKLLETAATDHYGRYSFLVGKSQYYVTAEKKGFSHERSKELDLRTSEGVVGVDFNLKKSV